MLFTVSTTYQPATDLGYLLVKHPDRVHRFDLPTGSAYVLYPEASAERCTAALLLDVDPAKLARRQRQTWVSAGGGAYVNDRPYAATSLLATAIAKVFGSALRGVSRDRPELAEAALPLQIEVPALPCRGGAALAEALFQPLHWRVEAAPIPCDPTLPEWGDSRYVRLTLQGDVRLAEALNHLYVLLPVLDDAKHYWVTADEVDKLLRAGAGWLPQHPERELITRRYLIHQRGMVDEALARLDALDESTTSDGTGAGAGAGAAYDEEAHLPAGVARAPLAAARRAAVRAALVEAGATSVLDLGCGGGALLAELLADPRYTRLVGADVSARALTLAERRLGLAQLPDRQRDRITLWQTGLTYQDDRLRGFDAAVLMEVIEHVDPARLPTVVDAVFGHARPTTVVVTTPNVEYNVRYPGLAPGQLRHPDHRFEWSRAEFADWAGHTAARYGYRMTLRGVGAPDPAVGAPTQLAVFTRQRAIT